MAKNRPIDTKGKKGYKSKFGVFFLSVEWIVFFLFMLFSHPFRSSLKLGFFYPPPKNEKEQFAAVWASFSRLNVKIYILIPCPLMNFHNVSLGVEWSWQTFKRSTAFSSKNYGEI